MEMKLYLRMLQKNWWIILLTALFALTISLGFSYAITPQYRATARFIINPVFSLDANDVVDSLDTLDRRSVVATYVEVMKSNNILFSAVDMLNLNAITVQENYTIQAVILPDSSVLELSVSGPNPNISAGLANEIGKQTIIFTNNLNQVYVLNYLDSAQIPLEPFSPQPLRDAGLALILGVSFGMILAILSEQIRVPLESFRRRLHLDPITEVYNSRYFASLLSDELSSRPDNNLSLGLIEIHNIEGLLDTIPLAGLHNLLRKVTKILRLELRGNDIIGRRGEVNFIIMLPETPSKAAILTFERIHKALLKPIELSQYGMTINLAPHIGAAVYSDNITSTELIEKVEISLERSRGDNDIPFYLWEKGNPFWADKS